jgi:EpsI family protein
MTVRLFVSALALLGIYGAAEVLKGRGMPTELAVPQLKLDEMPKTFGGWKGDDTPLDPQVFQAIGAKMAINRRYKDKLASVELHSDVFLNYSVRILHPPELCYSSNGFTVNDGETVELNATGEGSHPARFLPMDRDGARTYCLYWYQVGDTTFWTGDDQRRVVLSFRGRATWPPMLKVMLQTEAASRDEAQGRLKDLAAQVYAWTRQYH